MIYTRKIQKAIRFAIKTHEGYQKQKRKGTDVPYIVHSLSVGLLLSLSGAPEDLVVAGILHDTIEDSIEEKKVTKEMLTEKFNMNVAQLVDSVTEQDKSLPWQERKNAAVEHIKTFSNDSVFLKSADVVTNTSELLVYYEKEGEEIFMNFHAPKEKLLKQHIASIEALLKKWPENPLADDLKIIKEKLLLIN